MTASFLLSRHFYDQNSEQLVAKNEVDKTLFMVKKTMCLSAFASYMLSFLTCLHFFTFFTCPSFFLCLYFHACVTCPHFLRALSAFIFLPALRAFNLLRARLTFIFFTCLHFFTCLVCIGTWEKIF